MVIYRYKYPPTGREVAFYTSVVGEGIQVAGAVGVTLPDDEIPALISALQDYMSKRAKQITRAAGNGR